MEKTTVGRPIAERPMTRGFLRRVLKQVGFFPKKITGSTNIHGGIDYQVRLGSFLDAERLTEIQKEIVAHCFTERYLLMVVVADGDLCLVFVQQARPV